MTIDDLAVLVQSEFQIMRDELASKKDLKALTTKEDLAKLEKRVDLLEERMENGFYNVNLELKEIRALIKKIDTRKQVADLTVRVERLEKRMGL